MIPMLVDSDPAAEPAFGARIFLPRKVRPRVHRTTDAAAPEERATPLQIRRYLERLEEEPGRPAALRRGHVADARGGAVG
jgi:hypothetical protein